MTAPARPHAAWPGLSRLAAAAIAGSILLMLAVASGGPSAVTPPLPRTWPAPPWWLSLRLPAVAAEALTVIAVVLGAAGVTAGLIAVRRGARPPARLLLTAGLAAVAALTVLPPAGSSDSLSYAAYGRIAVTGQSPYQVTPAQLRAGGDVIGRQGTGNWQHTPSVYGPLATASQWAAAELGGSSIGRIVFWLKLWLALAFAAVAVGLDRLLRADPAARARAHLLWTLNPLMLWAIMAGAHIDGLAAGLGFLGLLLARQSHGMVGPLRAAGAGLLIGLAATVKLPLLLFGAGLLAAILTGALALREGTWQAEPGGWPSHRHPARWMGQPRARFAVLRLAAPALAAAAVSAGVILAAGYWLAGPAALRVLRADDSRVADDSLWRLLYGFGTAPGWLFPVAIAACVALAVLLAWRLPARSPGPTGPTGLAWLAGIRLALGVTLAWLLIWPMQRSWYDAMAFCLLAAFPASRLDWLLVARSVPATADLITVTGPGPLAAARAAARPAAIRTTAAAGRRGTAAGTAATWLHATAAELGRLAVPGIRLAAVAVAVALCLTGAWGIRDTPNSGPAEPEQPG